VKTTGCSLVAALVVLSAAGATADPKVLLFSIDGCRPDALQAADTPNVDALIAAGAVSYTAESSHLYTHSGPNYSSMLTGVDTPKHGVIDNSFNGNHFDLWPSFFHRLRGTSASLYMASYVNWGPINTAIHINDVANMAGSGADTWVASQAANLLTTGNPDVLFVELEGVDTEGHGRGFSLANPYYLQAIHTADGQVGSVLNALHARPGYISGAEDWLVVATTDHGGQGTGHEPSGGAETWTTFMITTGRSVTPGASIGSPRVYDVAVTAMQHMGLNTAGMNLDGSIVGIAESIWNVNGNGNWSSAASWTGAVPNGIRTKVTFSGALGAPRVVTVDAPVAVTEMVFNGPNTYTLTGPSPVALQAVGDARVQSMGGNHEISAGMTVQAHARIAVDSGELAISGRLDNTAGKTITKTGSARLILAGDQAWGSGAAVNVNAGTLKYELESSRAVTVAGGNSVTVAAGAVLELAGSRSALSDGTHHVNVITDSGTSLLNVSGTGQAVGGIDGAGNTVIQPGADLTADYIHQDTLEILGTGSVTIRPGAAGSGSLWFDGPTLGDMPTGTGGAAGDAYAGSYPRQVPEPGSLVLLGCLAAAGVFWMDRIRACLGPRKTCAGRDAPVVALSFAQLSARALFSTTDRPARSGP